MLSFFRLCLEYNGLGKDENSTKLSGLIDSEAVTSLLESEQFVAIKIESDKEEYNQFVKICELNIGTGHVISSEKISYLFVYILCSSRSTRSRSLNLLHSEWYSAQGRHERCQVGR